MKYISFAVSVAIVVTMVVPTSLFAQTMTVQQQLDLIQQLMAQVQALQAQLAQMQGRTEVVAPATSVASVIASPIVTTLSQGSRGDEVSVMQALLALDVNAYPSGLVTGYFGALSNTALRAFQKNQKLMQNGTTDAKTRDALNALLQKNTLAFETVSGTRRLCAAIPQGVAMPSAWTRNQQGTTTAVVPRCTTMPSGSSAQSTTPSQSISTVPITTINQSASDRNPPVISNITITATVNSATIKWSTDKEVQTTLDWWEKPQYITTVAETWFNETWTKTHSKSISGLKSDTIYYVRITARDRFGNMTVYPEQVLQTKPEPDKTPPGILSVRVDRSATSAVIHWTTNEPAKGKVYYGTITPLKTNATTTQSVAGTAFATSTSMSVSGLEIGKIYYFVIEATDEAGNKRLSEERNLFSIF